jgi:hypothetical protein
VAAPSNWIWDTAPDCIIRDAPPGNPFSQELMDPFQQCTGFFTFGPGTEWAGAAYGVIPVPEGADVGDVIVSASGGLWAITVLGFAVMILAFIAWVWLENRKLVDRATRLRAAAARGPAPPTAAGEGGGSGG